jgi:hypothetical protein
MLHCRPSELDDESAVELDWLLAVDNTVEKVRKTLEEREANKNAG